jgi:hypothetical protein
MVAVAHSPPPDVVLKDFLALSPKKKNTGWLLTRCLNSSGKPSPQSNASTDVELKKKNVGIVLAFREGDADHAMAYLVYQRMKRLTWLHKVCIIEQRRQKGVGKCLIQTLHLRTKRGSVQSIQL